MAVGNRTGLRARMKSGEVAMPGAIIFTCGTTVPSNGTGGYPVGSLFIHTDGGAATTLYINEGSASSSDFNAVTTS